MSSPYRHIVLFRIHDDGATTLSMRLSPRSATPVTRAGCSSGGSSPPTTGARGRVVVVNGLFADREDFTRWRTSSVHDSATERMAGIAHWWIGDYAEELRP